MLQKPIKDQDNRPKKGKIATLNTETDYFRLSGHWANEPLAEQ